MGGGGGDVDLQHSSVKTTTRRRGAGGCADAPRSVIRYAQLLVTRREEKISTDTVVT